MVSLSCKLTGLPSLPTYSGDCSSSGKATLTGADICLKHITKETRLKAKIELQVCILILFQILGFLQKVYMRRKLTGENLLVSAILAP